MTATLVLDTNVLRQEGMSSRGMQILSRLINAGEVELYLPDIVCREFVSQKIIDVQEQVQKCLVALSDISRHVGSKSKMQSDLIELKGRLNHLAEGAAAEINADFKEWLKISKTKLIEFEASDIVTVFNDYFAGSGAFRRPKHRDDFPDAVVSMTIRRLLKEREYVYIAVKDQVFKKHLQSEAKYRVVDGLSEFLDFEEIKSIISKLDSEAKNAVDFKKLVLQPEFQYLITEYLKSAKDLLEEVYVEQDQISGVEALEVDAWGVSLNYAQANAIERVDYYGATYIEQGHLSIEISIQTAARIDFAAYGYEVNSLSPERNVDNWSMNGDGVCALREVRSVNLIGYVEIIFPESWSPEELAIHSHYIGVNSSRIQVELDIQEAIIY